MFVHAPVGLHSLRTMVPSVWGLEIVLVLVGNAHLSLQMYIGIQKKNDRETESTSASQSWFGQFSLGTTGMIHWWACTWLLFWLPMEKHRESILSRLGLGSNGRTTVAPQETLFLGVRGEVLLRRLLRDRLLGSGRDQLRPDWHD